MKFLFFQLKKTSKGLRFKFLKLLVKKKKIKYVPRKTTVFFSENC